MRRALLVVVGSLCLVVLAPTQGSLGSSAQEEAPCLKRHHLPAFTAYSLGTRFAGLPRTSMSLWCFAAGPAVGPHPSAVSWVSDAVYGSCTPEGFEGGCGPPLDIQSWPECDRNLSLYGKVESPKALSPRRSFSLSGSYKIPTHAFGGGLSNDIELYTGQTTIVVFSDGPGLALRAVRALAREVAPSLKAVSGHRLRELAVSARGCHRS